MTEPGWQRRFAWLPVRIEDGRLRWLCCVERRAVVMGYDYLWHLDNLKWVYRDPQ